MVPDKDKELVQNATKVNTKYLKTDKVLRMLMIDKFKRTYITLNFIFEMGQKTKLKSLVP